MADCNTLKGTWTAGSGGTLALQIGPSSLVACGEDSLSDLYIIGLNRVASYAIASAQLTLTTDDGGTLVYKAARPATRDPMCIRAGLGFGRQRNDSGRPTCWTA